MRRTETAEFVTIPLLTVNNVLVCREEWYGHVKVFKSMKDLFVLVIA